MRQTGSKTERQLPHPIADNSWMWSKDFGDGETFFNSYWIQIGPKQAVIIDPLLTHASGKSLNDWSVFEELPKPQAIWLTSSDHERSSRQFAQHFNIPVVAAKAESGLLSHRPERTFEDGDELPGGWQVLQLNHQKTPGECVFYHAKNQLLVVGDAILAGANGCLRCPYDEPSYADEETARQALNVLADLKVKGVLVGHGEPVFQNPKARLQEALETDPRALVKQGCR